MSCVTPTNWVISSYMCFMVARVLPISSAWVFMSAMRSFISFMFCIWPAPCMLMRNGSDVCWMGVPSGRVIAWTLAIPCTRNTALAILSMTRKSDELRRS